MNTVYRKTLSLANRPAKIPVSKPVLTSVSSEGYHMDDWTMDDRGNRYGTRHNEESTVNKIRRGPGRRLAKEKRIRSMDPALMQKYSTLSPALQEKINAAIEIYYQQQMARTYKGQQQEDRHDSEDHYAEDLVYDADEPLGK